MNQYSELLFYLKSLLEADPLVKTVTQGDFDKVSQNKMIVYTLAHIVIDDASFTNGQTVGFNVQIAAIDQVDSNPELKEGIFFNNNNEVDVFNETLGILNRLWCKLNQDFEDKGIKAPDNCTCNKWMSDVNSAVGFVLNFSVELDNRTMKLS